jgi:hypothetical protein
MKTRRLRKQRIKRFPRRRPFDDFDDDDDDGVIDWNQNTFDFGGDVKETK